MKLLVTNILYQINLVCGGIFVKKKLWAVIAIGLSVITLVGCSTNNSKSGASSSSTSKTYKVEKAFKNATTDVNSLFEIRYSKLRDGLKKDEIDEVSREVKALSSKKGHGLKPILKDHIGIAYKLYPKFANDQSSKSSIKAAKSSSRASEESSEDASLEAASSSIEAEESSKSAASSKTALASKQKEQAANKEVMIASIQEMHDRIDGTDGISEKVLALGDSKSINRSEFKMQIKVLDNVINECNDHIDETDEYSQDFLVLSNEFWNLSSEILTTQKTHLKYLLSDASEEYMSSKKYSATVKRWNELYKQITNS